MQRFLLFVIGLSALAAGWGVYSGQLETSQADLMARQLNEFMVRRAFIRQGYRIDTHTASIWVCCVLGTLSILLAMRPGKSALRKNARDVLERVLFMWTPTDPCTLRDALSGGIAIFGGTGSGKTSGSGKLIGEALVRLPGSGGLILAAKTEDLPMWQRLFERCGRRGDLLVFDPSRDLRMNFLNYEMERSGGHTRNITKAITTIAETLRSGDTKGGDSDEFWVREQERMIYNAVHMVKLATDRVDAWDLQRLVTGAAPSVEQLQNPAWRKGFHCLLLDRAFQSSNITLEEQRDFELALDYWVSEIPAMADKTRSSIMVGVLGILHVFNTGVVREMVSGGTNCSPDDMQAGKWILVNMAPSQWGEIGSFICAGWKYLTQKAILRRQAKPGDPINVIWCDEAHLFVNSHDHHYLAQCRSRLACMVFLSQSLPSYYAALKGESGKNQTEALQANFHTKIFHALGDYPTAEWASNLIGRRRTTFIGGSMAPAESVYDELFGRSRFTGSFSEQMSPTLEPKEFMNGLRMGGAANGFMADAIVVRSGQPFSKGENWIRAAFSQR
jgi:hypothetical protein